MSKINALKFLLLVSLKKNKCSFNEKDYLNIAYSIKLIKDLKSNEYILSFLKENKKIELIIDINKFKFYNLDSSSRHQGQDNKNYANDIIKKIHELYI